MRPTPLLFSLTLALNACGDEASNPPPGRYDAHGAECPMHDPLAEVTLTAHGAAPARMLEVTTTFRRSLSARDEISCRSETVGACVVQTCRRIPLDFVDGEPTCGPTSAGALTVARGAGAPLTFATTGFASLSTPFTTGETYVVRTTGGDIPAFTASVRAPAALTLRTPEALARGAGLTLAPAEDLRLTWTPVPSRVVVRVLTTVSADRSVECSFDGSAGEATVPAAILGEATGHVSVATEARVEQRAGAFPVAVRARWEAVAFTQFSR